MTSSRNRLSIRTSARSTTFSTLPAGASTTFTLTPLNMGGDGGPGASRTVRRTALTARPSTTRVAKAFEFRVHGTLTRPDGRTPVAGQPVRIQVRALHGTTWKTVVTRTSRADGTITARPVIYGSSYVRAAFPGSPGWVGSMSGATKVVAY